MRRRRSRLAIVVLAAATMWSCSGGAPPERAWLAVEVLANGDAVISLAAPPGDNSSTRILREAATELFPEGTAGTPSRLGGTAEPRVTVAVTDALQPGASPAFVVDASALGQPIDSALGAVEVCLPPVDIDVEVGRGSPPAFTDGCYVLLRGELVRFTLQPEGWRLPAAMLGALGALALALIAWRSRLSRAPWVAGACLLVIAITVLAASDAATAALLAGATGPVVPAWLFSRMILAAAGVLAIVAWARAARARAAEPA